VALAEMALAGGLGAEITLPEGAMPTLHGWLFGEDQARYLVTLPNAAALLEAAAAAGIAALQLGETGGKQLILPGARPISLERLRDAHEGWLPAYMEGPA
jgi:phosphoribosylformylglycinamidine synthase